METWATFTRVRTNFYTDKNVHGSTLRLHGTGGTGRVFERSSSASLGPEKRRSQTCTLSCSKIRPVPPVPCKRKVEPCKFFRAKICSDPLPFAFFKIRRTLSFHVVVLQREAKKCVLILLINFLFGDILFAFVVCWKLLDIYLGNL